MAAVLLRRRKLGHKSCRDISGFSTAGLGVVRNDSNLPAGTDLVFRWGTTSNVPCNNVVNTAHAIHGVNDKTGFRRILNEHDLCPATWFSIDAVPHDAFPVIVRPAHHSQGRHLHVCNSYVELQAACRVCGPGHYISKLINKVAEYRVAVVQGRAVWVAKKTPGNPDDVAWNVARGGRFDNVNWGDWPLRVVKCAIEGFNLSELDFGGVDVMVDAEGTPYILEINSAPSQTSPYRQQCMAKSFDYIIRNGKDRIPLIEARGGYRKFIHPAICDTAQLP